MTNTCPQVPVYYKCVYTKEVSTDPDGIACTTMTNKSLLWSDGVNFHLHTRHDWPKLWKITEGPVIFFGEGYWQKFTLLIQAVQGEEPMTSVHSHTSDPRAWQRANQEYCLDRHCPP